MSAANNTRDQNVAPAMLSIFNGDEEPFEGHVLLTVHNRAEVQPKQIESKGPYVQITVPFHNGPGDSYAVCVSSDGYRDGGCFFQADPKVLAEPKVILIANTPTLRFQPWSSLKLDHPIAATFLSVGTDDATAKANYEKFGRQKPKSLACLLNLTQAMSEIDLEGRSPLEFFKEICRDESMAQDRFYGYVDPAIIPIIRAAAAKREFSEETDCATFHPGAICSWKQNSFAITNVQLTFHENDKKASGGINCVKIEPDIDLYKDLVEHGLMEVFPNLITGEKTNPIDVFSLRWTLAQDEGGPKFDPGYELV